MSNLVSDSGNFGGTENAESISSYTSHLPEKSKIRYNQMYESFLKWCTTKDIQKTTENVMMAYFMERSEVLKSPSSLWGEYSMLKLIISIQQNQDISKFQRLKAFLKQKNEGYQPRKTKVFNKEEIERFIAEAPDHIYLLMKVVAIMGVVGACSTGELHKIKLKDIDLKDDVAIVRILETNNTVRRSFIITNNLEGSVDWLKLLQTYMKLRPHNAVDERFFFRYERGRCVDQLVGKNTISKVPQEIAKFLKLNDVYQYTGCAFRKSSAAFLSNVYDAFVKSREKWNSSHVIKRDIIIPCHINKEVVLNSKSVFPNSSTSSETQKSIISFTCEDSRNSLSPDSNEPNDNISHSHCDSEYKYIVDDSEIILINEDIVHLPDHMKHEQRSDEESTDESQFSICKNDTDLFFEMISAKVKRFSPYHKNLIENKIFLLVQKMELEQIQPKQ